MYTKYKIVPFCPYHFVQYHFFQYHSVCIPFCPYHFVRYHFVHYHFVRSPLHAICRNKVFPDTDYCLRNGSAYSFIHYKDLYSTSSRLLLRNTSYTCMVKKSSFQARVECVRMNPGEQSQGQWKPILHRGPVTENAKIYIAPLQGYYS